MLSSMCTCAVCCGDAVWHQNCLNKNWHNAHWRSTITNDQIIKAS